MIDEPGQPEPARPAVPHGPAWLRYDSEISEVDVHELLPARAKACSVTPGLQRAITCAAVVAALAAIAAAVLFDFSHFRAMDILYGVDNAGNKIGGLEDYTVAGMVLIAGIGVGLAIAGAWLDVAARTRAVLMTAGATVMVLIGAGVGLLLDPSRADLVAHYHVGEWGTRASFVRLFRGFDAAGWLVAVSGVAVLVFMIVQRRKVAAAYPEQSGA